MPPKKLLLFDIDGTLLLTGGAGQIAFEKAFLELFQIDQCWGDLIPDGKTDPAIIEEITQRTLGRSLSTSEYELLCRKYHDIFAQEINNASRFRLMPGVAELLTILNSPEEFFLSIATGNFQEAAWMKLERGSIRNFFKCGGFGCDSPNRTELTRQAIRRSEQIMGQKIDRQNMLLIGDTLHDIRVGKELGVKTIAVATGSTTVETLKSHSPEWVLKDLSDIPGFLRLIETL